MKKVFSVIGLSLVALICVVMFRTITLSSRQVQVVADTAGGIALDSTKLAERLAGAIRFQTVSFKDAARFDGQAFKGLHTYLEQHFPLVHQALSVEAVGDYSLLYTWQGLELKQKPILLLAHMDVVPAESETGRWTHPPFEGTVADGFIWGRGTLDVKVTMIGMLESIEKLLGEGFVPRRTIYLAFGHDEEVGGSMGATGIAAILQSRGVAPAFVLDEGLAITEGVVPIVAAPVAGVGIAEKGFFTIELSVSVAGGHSSMPPANTAIGILSSAVSKLEHHQLPMRIDGPLREMFQYLAPETSFPTKMVFANLWLFQGLVKRQFADSPVMNALARTTTAPTIFKAGLQENVLPAEASAVINFRIKPGDTTESILEHVRSTIGDQRITIKPFTDDISEPSPVSETESQNFHMLASTIRQVFPKALVAPGLMIGATDSRHYAGLTRHIYRFLPISFQSEDLARIHGINERVSTQAYENVVRFYLQLIRNTDAMQ